MIPRVSKGGGSFHHAGLYYLHDKGTTASAERVAFSETINLPTDDPEKAFKVMAWTADHQADLKLATGGSAVGRKLEKPVYTYSLSWAPHEKPDRADMTEAAKASLKTLGMRDHQAVLIAHNDTAHPHIHVIVNRVHPVNGRAASTSCDTLKLSKWAERYERQRGQILVDQRVINNAQRAEQKAKPKRDRVLVKNENLSRQEWAIVRKYQRMTPEQIRQQRAMAQSADRMQLISRHNRARSLFEEKMRRTYGQSEKALTDEIRAVKDRIGTTGFFRRAVRRLIGADARDNQILKSLEKSKANLDWRKAEQKAALEARLAREKDALDNRQRTECARDERLIDRAAKETEKQGTRGMPPPTRARQDRAEQQDGRQAVSRETGNLREKARQVVSREAQPKAERPKTRTRNRNRNRNRSRDQDRELGD